MSGRNVINMHQLKGLSVEQFERKILAVLYGDSLYRTADGRVVDFRLGTEHIEKRITIQAKK